MKKSLLISKKTATEFRVNLKDFFKIRNKGNTGTDSKNENIDMESILLNIRETSNKSRKKRNLGNQKYFFTS